ncbi:MAG TPA: DNA topoisomerase I [Arenicellales bacterium]|nr:DNA topoisomerase I [Arenicellales bacterium]
MSKNLIVVESPAKARTITKYLGKGFKAMASYGHVRDLVPKSGAVDPDNEFEMSYEVIDRNKKHVDAIARELKDADALYLATDPDREGEAIAWHLYELLKQRGVLNGKDVHRVEFYEFTKKAIQHAVAHPRELSESLINAQQSRRALDYLVGFNLSPLLWRKVSPGLSAGRVQSPALRLIVEREEEIEKFEPQEYWTIEADLEADDKPFTAKLTHLQGEKLTQFSINSEELARKAENTIEAAARGELKVDRIERKQRKRNPAPPFTTSTLQQEASRKLGFGAQRTMRTAQQLYEGIEIDGELVGLITYMRTDAVNLSDDAVAEIREFIGKRYGTENVPDKPQVYKNKSKNAQEAHEAIRTTMASRLPEHMKSALSNDQYRLYELIWQRTVACQMIHATLDTVAVDLAAGNDAVFRANGSSIVHPGFMVVYQEGKDDAKETGDQDQKILPPLKEKDMVPLKQVRPEQHFTEPPPRYSEASLVKTLEAYGIGRPSTYASIISTLLAREYVTLENRRFQPTDVGRIVNHFLSSHFSQYVDYDFTARMEDELDSISRGEEDWLPLMKEFWEPFKQRVEEKANVPREEVAQARNLGTDPKSGKPVSVRLGRYGPFAQIGTKEDEDKPRFAGLRPGQKMSEITLEEALELFKLPRELGESPDGEKIVVGIGRFGPYIRYDDKFVSLKDDDPYTVSLERALELVAEKKQADANRIIKSFPDKGIQVLRGRYGPYVTNGEKNAKIPKDTEPESLTLEQCEAMIEAAPVRKKKTGKKKKSAKKATGKIAKKATKKTSKKTSKKKAAGKKAAGKSSAGTSRKVSKKATEASKASG